MTARLRSTRSSALGAGLAALGLLFSLAGCGSDASGAEQSDALRRRRTPVPSPTPPPPSPTPPPPPPTTPAPAPVTGTATIAWQVPLAGPYSSVRPAVGPDGTVYAIDVIGNLYAVAPDGSIKWQVAGAGNKGLAVGADGTVYVGSEDAVHAFGPDGAARWTFVQSPRAFILLGLAVGPDGNVYGVATQGIGVFSLTPQGALRWATPEIYDRPNVTYGEILFGSAPSGTQLYFYANAHVRALDLSGRSVFTLVGGGPPAVSPLDGSVHIGDSAYRPDGSFLRSFGLSAGGPIDVGPDGVTYFDFLQSAAYAVNAAGGQKWTATASDWIQAPTVDPTNAKVVFLASDTTRFAAVLVAFSTSGAPLFRLAFPDVNGVKQVLDTRIRFTPDGTTAYLITDVNTSSFATSHAMLTAVKM
ncbi:MAG TPA: PQQ-binding-like beta-propeller repeat protein [Anaeromyxobacter sp.]